jgi:hypothetical protein
MNYNITSWNSYQIRPRSKLGHIKPLIIIGGVSIEHMNKLATNPNISLNINNTQLYDTNINAHVFDIQEDGRVFFLLDHEWFGYPYELGDITVLESVVYLKQNHIQKYSNMGIKTYETNNSIQYNSDNDLQHIFCFRRQFNLSTKKPNYNLTPEVLNFINQNSIV